MSLERGLLAAIASMERGLSENDDNRQESVFPWAVLPAGGAFLANRKGPHVGLGVPVHEIHNRVGG